MDGSERKARDPVQRPSEQRSDPTLKPTSREVGLVASLFAAMLVSTFPEFTLGVLAPILVDELGVGEASVGIAASAMYLGAAVFARTAGRRLDDIGGRTGLILLYGAAIGSLTVLAASRSLAWLVVAGFLGSFALGTNNPMSSRFIVAAVAPARRGLAIGIKQTGVKTGQMLAGAMLPWLAATLGWRSGLLAFAGVMVVLLLVSLPTVPSTPLAATQSGQSSVAEARARVRWLQLYAVSMAVGHSAITTYLALYAVQRLYLSLTAGGLLVSTFAVTAVVSRLVWVSIADRIGHPSLILLIISFGALLGLLSFVAALTLGPAMLWVGAVVTGVTVGSWNVIVQLAVLAEVDALRTASATGAVQAAFMFGMAAGAPLFGGVLQLTGSFLSAWVGALLMAAIAFVTAATRYRSLRPS